jgi:hypothetical protein
MMTGIIIGLAGLTLVAGIVMVINLNVIFGVLRKHVEKLELHILAIVVRLVLGVVVIVQSNVSKFPLVIEILGWIAIVAAIVLGVIGRHNFKRLMAWALSLATTYAALAGLSQRHLAHFSCLRLCSRNSFDTLASLADEAIAQLFKEFKVTLNKVNVNPTALSP